MTRTHMMKRLDVLEAAAKAGLIRRGHIPLIGITHLDWLLMVLMSDQNCLSFDNLLDFSLATGVSVDWLLHGTGSLALCDIVERQTPSALK